MRLTCSYPNAVPFRLPSAFAQYQHDPFTEVDIVHAKHLFYGNPGWQVVEYKIKGDGHWSLVIGHWSLVIGHWSLVIGHWSVVIAILGITKVIIFSKMPAKR